MKQKSGVTFGNGWMFSALIFLLKHIPIRVFYAFMSIFVIPVTLVVSPGARLTYRYFRRHRHQGRWQSWLSVYRNHCVFGQTVIDKFAMYAGHQFRIAYHGLEKYEELVAADGPLIILNAHIGCSEIVGYSYRVSKPCNVLAYGGEKAQLMALRSASFGEMNMRMIPVGTADSHSDEIIEALDRGEIVTAFADRFANRRKVLTSHIHGDAVNLSRGPISLAVTRGIPVIMASAMKEKDGSYSAFITVLGYDRTQPSKVQRQQLADAYTAEINRLLDKYPMQWFNYFNIWVES